MKIALNNVYIYIYVLLKYKKIVSCGTFILFEVRISKFYNLDFNNGAGSKAGEKNCYKNTIKSLKNVGHTENIFLSFIYR